MDTQEKRAIRREHINFWLHEGIKSQFIIKDNVRMDESLKHGFELSLFTNDNEEIVLIASGYDWICPECDEMNHVIEVLESVTCSACHKTFNVQDYHHALP